MERITQIMTGSLRPRRLRSGGVTASDLDGWNECSSDRRTNGPNHTARLGTLRAATGLMGGNKAGLFSGVHIGFRRRIALPCVDLELHLLALLIVHGEGSPVRRHQFHLDFAIFAVER
jgi:hypothetical protein